MNEDTSYKIFMGFMCCIFICCFILMARDGAIAQREYKERLHSLVNRLETTTETHATVKLEGIYDMELTYIPQDVVVEQDKRWGADYTISGPPKALAGLIRELKHLNVEEQ